MLCDFRTCDHDGHHVNVKMQLLVRPRANEALANFNRSINNKRLS